MRRLHLVGEITDEMDDNPAFKKYIKTRSKLRNSIFVGESLGDLATQKELEELEKSLLEDMQLEGCRI